MVGLNIRRALLVVALCIRANGSLSGEKVHLKTLAVLEGRFLVGDYPGFAVDLPQNESRERILSVYDSDRSNENQTFVLIPAEGDAWFICAKRTGAVIGVRPASMSASALIVGS